MEQPERIERLERRVRALMVALFGTGVAIVVGAWQAHAPQPEVLRVRQITVVDASGTERVWIGAPVPDPIVNGKRGKRKGSASGMVLLDAKGNERAGYLTGDAVGEVWIGLDSERAQEVTFLANPGGGAHLSFADGKGTGAKLSTVGGRPTLRLVDKGHTVFERPRSE